MPKQQAQALKCAELGLPPLTTQRMRTKAGTVYYLVRISHGAVVGKIGGADQYGPIEFKPSFLEQYPIAQELTVEHVPSGYRYTWREQVRHGAPVKVVLAQLKDKISPACVRQLKSAYWHEYTQLQLPSLVCQRHSNSGGHEYYLITISAAAAHSASVRLKRKVARTVGIVEQGQQWGRILFAAPFVQAFPQLKDLTVMHVPGVHYVYAQVPLDTVSYETVRAQLKAPYPTPHKRLCDYSKAQGLAIYHVNWLLHPDKYEMADEGDQEGLEQLYPQELQSMFSRELLQEAYGSAYANEVYGVDWESASKLDDRWWWGYQDDGFDEPQGEGEFRYVSGAVAPLESGPVAAAPPTLPVLPYASATALFFSSPLTWLVTGSADEFDDSWRECAGDAKSDGAYWALPIVPIVVDIEVPAELMEKQPWPQTQPWLFRNKVIISLDYFVEVLIIDKQYENQVNHVTNRLDQEYGTDLFERAVVLDQNGKPRLQLKIKTSDREVRTPSPPRSLKRAVHDLLMAEAPDNALTLLARLARHTGMITRLEAALDPKDALACFEVAVECLTWPCDGRNRWGDLRREPSEVLSFYAPLSAQYYNAATLGVLRERLRAAPERLRKALSQVPAEPQLAVVYDVAGQWLVSKRQRVHAQLYGERSAPWDVTGTSWNELWSGRAEPWPQLRVRRDFTWYLPCPLLSHDVALKERRFAEQRYLTWLNSLFSTGRPLVVQVPPVCSLMHYASGKEALHALRTACTNTQLPALMSQDLAHRSMLHGLDLELSSLLGPVLLQGFYRQKLPVGAPLTQPLWVQVLWDLELYQTLRAWCRLLYRRLLPSKRTQRQPVPLPVRKLLERAHIIYRDRRQSKPNYRLDEDALERWAARHAAVVLVTNRSELSRHKLERYFHQGRALMLAQVLVRRLAPQPDDSLAALVTSLIAELLGALRQCQTQKRPPLLQDKLGLTRYLRDECALLRLMASLYQQQVPTTQGPLPIARVRAYLMVLLGLVTLEERPDFYRLNHIRYRQRNLQIVAPKADEALDESDEEKLDAEASGAEPTPAKTGKVSAKAELLDDDFPEVDTEMDDILSDFAQQLDPDDWGGF